MQAVQAANTAREEYDETLAAAKEGRDKSVLGEHDLWERKFLRIRD
jgi:hypothetical protein